MNWFALLGALLVAYCLFVLYVVLKKPEKIWGIKKIQGFVKTLGNTGTHILFIAFALAAGGVGVWLLVR